MNIQPFRAWYPKLEQIPSADVFFSTLKEKYVTYREANLFKQLPDASLFIYRILAKDSSYTGIMVCTPTTSYEDGHILKHENTLARKEERAKQLILHRQAIVKPILLTYPSLRQINQLLLQYIENNPTFSSTYLEAEQQTHQLWAITDASVSQRLQQLFKQEVKTSYIADGHHRTTAMSLLKQQFGQQNKQGDFSQLLVTLFGSDQLKVHAFNRVMEVLQDYTPSAFLKKLSNLFSIEKLVAPRKPSKKFELVLFLAQEWYVLTWKKAILQRHNQAIGLLDVQLLNEHVLKGILGITDIRNDQRIQYVEGTKGLKGLETATLKNEQSVGFYLYPVQIEELMAMADQHILLPPKSTYFEPRIKNGLLIKRL